MKRPLRCWLGRHDWHHQWDHERSARYRVCSLCGKRMGTGWPGGSAMGA